jgi:hypothetical protein
MSNVTAARWAHGRKKRLIESHTVRYKEIQRDEALNSLSPAFIGIDLTGLVAS